MLRAIRRPRSPGSPAAESNGASVTASAPPTTAPSVAAVPRSRLTHGSTSVSQRSADTATICVESTDCPLCSSTVAQQCRRARSLATVANTSTSAVTSRVICEAAFSRPVERPQVRQTHRQHISDLLSLAGSRITGRGTGGDERAQSRRVGPGQVHRLVQGGLQTLRKNAGGHQRADRIDPEGSDGIRAVHAPLCQ